MKAVRIVFTLALVLAAISGYIASSVYLLVRSASESQLLVPAIAFTVIVGGMMILVLSIVARVTLGTGLQNMAQTAAFRVQCWTLGKGAK